MKVAILTYDQANLFELGCLVELFCQPRPEFEQWYQAEVVSFTAGNLRSGGGLQIEAKHVNDLENYDMLLIPSWWVTQKKMPTDLRKALEQFYSDGKRMVSFCSGAFLLAEMGFLDGRTATTHWRYEKQFRKRFPQIKYVDDVLYIYDMHIGCSAGSAAALDLGIEIIRRDYGYQTANHVAKRLVMSAHRVGGQSQFVETPILKVPQHFSQALQWATENLHKALDINDLAQKANMSRRTFDRKFRSTFSMSPHTWLIEQRIELAKSLLESNQLTIENVADQAGFSNAMTMRYHFRKKLNTSPSHYQQHFQCD